jgi:hypothetical protein
MCNTVSSASNKENSEGGGGTREELAMRINFRKIGDTVISTERQEE